MIVEVNSGRLEISTGNLSLKDPYCYTFAELLPSLLSSRKRQIRDSKEQPEKRRKWLLEERRRLTGTGMEFLVGD